MHIVFLNPQGNFDPKDSYLTEHPDFGGQLVYVKELAQALATNGHKVDIVTRKIIDSDWPEFSANQDIYPGTEQNLRILRFPCGGNKFLSKEELWPHLSEFADEIFRFYGESLPDFSQPITQMVVIQQPYSSSVLVLLFRSPVTHLGRKNLIN